MNRYIDFTPKVRPAANSIVEERKPPSLKDEVRAVLKELAEENNVPASPVMARYSALQAGRGSFVTPPIRIDPSAGKRQREVENALDDLVALIQHVVLPRGGQSSVVRRDTGEGGFIARITLPAGGGLSPSGISEILQQIQSVAFQSYPEARIDAIDLRTITGSPVSAADNIHILTLRVLVPLPQDISPTNDLSRTLKAVRTDDD